MGGCRRFLFSGNSYRLDAVCSISAYGMVMSFGTSREWKSCWVEESAIFARMLSGGGGLLLLTFFKEAPVR